MKTKIVRYVTILLAAVAGSIASHAKSEGSAKEKPQEKPAAYLIVEEYSETLNGPTKKTEICRLGLELGREGYSGSTVRRTYWRKTAATKNVNGATVTEVRNEPIKVAFGTEAWATLVKADTVAITITRRKPEGMESAPDGSAGEPIVSERKFATTLVFKDGQPITAGADGFGKLVLRLVPMQ